MLIDGILASPMTLFVVSSCTLLAGFIVFLSKYFFASRRPKNFPPGPPTVPFLGNVTQLPIAKSFLKYGDIHSVCFNASVAENYQISRMGQGIRLNHRLEAGSSECRDLE
jgi:hypothetical protein